jgi:hypothetical protein
VSEHDFIAADQLRSACAVVLEHAYQAPVNYLGALFLGTAGASFASAFHLSAVGASAVNWQLKYPANKCIFL